MILCFSFRLQSPLHTVLTDFMLLVYQGLLFLLFARTHKHIFDHNSVLTLKLIHLAVVHWVLPRAGSLCSQQPSEL